MENNIPSMEVRMESLLRLVAEEVRACRACGSQLAMVRHRNGRLGPYTLDGVNHFINCPAAAEFRKKKAESQS